LSLLTERKHASATVVPPEPDGRRLEEVAIFCREPMQQSLACKLCLVSE